MDSSFLKHIQSITNSYQDIVPQYLQDAVRKQEEIRAMSELETQAQVDGLRQLSELAKSIEAHQDRFDSALLRHRESARHWADALAIVQRELPKRGWYLTGQEPAGLTTRLAPLIEKEDWSAIDDILIEQASDPWLNEERFFEWLRQHGVPECCIKRFGVFLKARQDGEHEVATLVGVPLIDELCRSLYDGKDFTTKRSKRQPRPQMACVSGNGAKELSHYSKGFVEEFGLIHQDVDPECLEDDDYFNRSAILHGLMRRGYGPKDTAKTFMALMFLVFAFDEEVATPEESPTDDS
ncbi:MAG: hypothetical protein KDA52_06285 [Planctomycetaceae bacterium]|nr:hypothetical protein [Planctomycetaceae bacterium]